MKKRIAIIAIAMVIAVAGVDTLKVSAEEQQVEQVKVEQQVEQVKVEKGLYKLESLKESGFVEMIKYRDNSNFTVFIGEGGRYIEVKESMIAILYDATIAKADMVKEREVIALTEGVYVEGTEIREGTYTFTATSETGGIVYKLKDLVVDEGIEILDIYTVESGQEVEVEVKAGDIIQVIKAQGK